MATKLQSDSNDYENNSTLYSDAKESLSIEANKVRSDTITQRWRDDNYGYDHKNNGENVRKKELIGYHLV